MTENNVRWLNQPSEFKPLAALIERIGVGRIRTMPASDLGVERMCVMTHRGKPPLVFFRDDLPLVELSGAASEALRIIERADASGETEVSL